MGAVLAVGFYKLNKLLEYELANPGQDGDVENDPTQNDGHQLAQVIEDRALEVEEIAAIQEAGGFDAMSLGADPSVMEADAVTDVDQENGALEKEKTSTDRDLEAQWSHRSPKGNSGKSLKSVRSIA